jgi:2-polyprenyl-6-methoxyphenol hydroxylase-like FAD-dependent oxidoreductase
MNRFDVQVVGAGLVGQSLALALGRLGLQVALQATRAPAARADVRAFALNPASVALLRSLKVWDALPAGAATAVYDMRVQGDAPDAEIEFSAWQQRIGELAWITDAAVLERELATAVRFSPHVTRVDTEVEASLTALCEGGLGARRAALGAGFLRHEYGDRAIAARLRASLPHEGTARQWFRAPDVLALLPFDTPEPERSYALVWSMPVRARGGAHGAGRGSLRAGVECRDRRRRGRAQPCNRARRLAARAWSGGTLGRTGLGAAR